jgi:NACHT domain
MIQIKNDEIEVIIANAQKPITLSNFSYPLNSLDDRMFEILTYSIFKNRIKNNDVTLDQKFEDILLMQGIGEKGMDCVFTNNHKIIGLIQCKKYAKNLTGSQILTEIIKFSIHYYLDKDRFKTVDKFKYYVATSTGYSSSAIELLELITNGTFVQKYDFKNIVSKILLKYKEFKSIKFEDLEKEIPAIISNFKYEIIRPSDFNLWINNYPEIIETFFEIKKVTDNKLIEETKKEIISKIDNIFTSKEADEIESFITSYKTASLEKLNIINFIGFDLHRYRQRPTDITLTELFVQPSFHQRIDETNKKVESVINKDLKIANIFKSEKNVIILGDPGAGKSLLVKFIIVQILLGKESSIGLRQYAKHLPFRIELRKYNEVRENKSIIEYLADNLTKEYQTTIKIELLNIILKHNESLIFFDGLDEIFNVSHKTKMKENIESFSLNFPKSKCIVTSRFIGYHDIKFSSKKFDEFAIQQFNSVQIEELVSKFYATQIINTEKRNKSMNNCLSQIEKDVDDELKSNPLIMTLILILSSNNIVIPDSKLEIYEACTKTLVDSIDTKEKELNIEMPIKHKRLAFAHLAYWQYESLTKNQVINYDKAIKSFSDFLIEKGEVTEYIEAEEKSKKFLEYAEKRSIYFEDNFTHKTFLEYYTADYLYINFFTKASDSARRKVISIITTYLPKSFWYIVFELLLTRVDNEQADEELLDEIFKKQIETNSLNVFYFLISNFNKFVNVSDNVKKNILKKTILLCIKGEKVTELRSGFNFEENSLLAKINLLLANLKSLKLLQEVISEFENDGLSEKNLIEFYIFYFEVCSINRNKPNQNTLVIENKPKVKELAYKDLHLFSQFIISDRNKDEMLSTQILLDQIEHFGTKSLFTDLKFRHRENVTRIDTFDIYLMSAIETSDYVTFKSGYFQLIDSGLKNQHILEHVKKTRVYYFHRPENFEKVMIFFLKSDETKIDEIIVNLIGTSPSIRLAYKNFRTKNKNSKLKMIDEIFNK